VAIEGENRLRDAVFEELEIGLRQRRDGTALLVHDGDVDDDGFGAGAEASGLVRRRLRGGAPRDPQHSQGREQQRQWESGARIHRPDGRIGQALAEGTLAQGGRKRKGTALVEQNFSSAHQ
jgi:hypothetical protein